jgi:hypothetical protein
MEEDGGIWESPWGSPIPRDAWARAAVEPGEMRSGRLGGNKDDILFSLSKSSRVSREEEAGEWSSGGVGGKLLSGLG